LPGSSVDVHPPENVFVVALAFAQLFIIAFFDELFDIKDEGASLLIGGADVFIPHSKLKDV